MDAKRPGRSSRATKAAPQPEPQAEAGAPGAVAGPEELPHPRWPRPAPEPEKPRALIVAPRAPDVEVARAALGRGWHVVATARRVEPESVDPRTRLVLLDDRLSPSVLGDAKAVLARVPAARVVLAVGPESIGEILSAGLEGVRVGWVFRPLTAEAIAAELRELGDLPDDRPPSERRAFPRAALEEPAVVAPAGVDLRDISPGGALLIAPPGWAVGGRYQLEIRLTGGAPVQRVVGEVTRAEPAPLGRQVVAVRFVGPTARFQSLVRATILEHMTYRDLRKLLRRFREDASGATPIADPDRIEGLLRELYEHQRPCVITAAPRGQPWRSALSRVDAAARLVGIRRSGGSRRIHAGDGVNVFVHGSGESYLFELRVFQVGEGEISCTWPDVIYYSEKRSHPRRPVPREARAVLEVDAPAPWGTRTWPLHDVSHGGFSFVAPADGALLLPGTPLRRLRLRVGERTIAEHAGEIRHVAPLGDGAALVGVGLVEAARANGVERRQVPDRRGGAPGPAPAAAPAALATAKAAAVRTSPSPVPARRVRFLNSRQEAVSALLDTSVVGDERFSAPVVIVAPSFGRSKECFSTLAHWLCDRFARLGQPIAVVRFDFTHSKGESFIPEANRAAGRECLDFTLSSALDDLRATLRFVHQTPLFDPTHVVVVGYSMSAPLALRAAVSDPRISHVISAMGAPSFQDSTRNVMGGLDYIAGHLRGERLGLVNLLGYVVDMDALCRDAVSSRLATARDVQRDVAALQPSVTLSFLVGEHDGWVDRRVLDHVVAARRQGPRPDLVVLPTGHVPTMSEEAAAVAEETARLVWRTVHGGELPPGPGPSPEVLERVARDEWAKAPRAAIGDRRACWADYLLGKGDGELGFDILEWVDAYRDFMADQVRAVDARPGQVVLDVGGGTGNFLATLLRSGAPLPARLDVVDLVPEALERARAKTRAAVERAGLDVDFRVTSVEVSRLRPIERFVRGEVHGPEWLRGRVEGLDDVTLDRILELYGPAMHAALRGDALEPQLAHALSEHDRAVVEELGRAARLVRGKVREDDLRDGGAAAGGPPARTSHLRLDHLVLGDAAVDEPLPFESGAYDRVVASLLLPYLANPDETVRELHRALKPGGRVVISSNRPNTDMSEIFTKLVDDVERGRVPPPPGMDRPRFLDELRAYTSSAAFLLRLEDEHTFRFLSPEQLRHMLERAGFRDVEVRPSFGDPPQAHVAVGVKA
jgi:ubiquinone/menaquinone biosynthesis C-methylase UbiE/dienelactone hydrolase